MTIRRKALDYYRIEKAIRFLSDHIEDQPELSVLAREAGTSLFHFQKIFLRWAGITPKQFLKYITKEYAKKALMKSSVLDASYQSGLSGPGRLHDLMVTCEAVTPGEYKSNGKGILIEYGFHPTVFGYCFIAVTNRGVCALSFLEEDYNREVPRDFLSIWRNATIKVNQKKTAAYVVLIFHHKNNRPGKPIRILFRGTNFQMKVWEALLRIPSGMIVSYQDMAKMALRPQAVRAAGTAIGQNPVAYLIPCHRVIRSLGTLGGYRWGLIRKKMILGLEGAKVFAENIANKDQWKNDFTG